MSNAWFTNPGLSLLLALIAVAGCSDAPSRVPAPEWNPRAIAEAIRSQLDKNGDSVLNAEELQGAPGLAAGIKLIDTDGDGSLTEEEISKRFETYRRLAIGRTSPGFRFLFNGRPLANATIEFTPEPFLADVIKPAKGTTNAEGSVYPQTEGESFPGMQVGYYRIQVAAVDKPLPEKYTKATPLGVEVSGTNDNPSGYQTPTFRLDSK